MLVYLPDYVSHNQIYQIGHHIEIYILDIDNMDMAIFCLDAANEMLQGNVSRSVRHALLMANPNVVDVANRLLFKDVDSEETLQAESDHTSVVISSGLSSSEAIDSIITGG